MRPNSKSIVLSVDIGTTNIRCHTYNNKAEVIGKAHRKLNVLYPGEGRHEIQPELLWIAFIAVITECLKESELTAEDISCLGISTQRATFLTWNRETNENFHNFITWKDKRTESLCNQWNSTWALKLLRLGAHILYIITRIKKFQVASVFKFTSALVLPRLYWILNHDSLVRNNLQTGALFGTIDTWLVWKLTGGKVHATDGSNACVTGFFDPFTMKWMNWVLYLFNIPSSILPEVKNTCDCYGETLPEMFGHAIPIYTVVGDQQASMFGAGCFEKNDINCTMGTGSFLNMNTESAPGVSNDGVYPLVGWTISSKPTYILECGMHDVGSTMTLAQNLGFFKHPDESCRIAQSELDSEDVYFLPSACLLETAGKRNVNTSSWIGLSAQTNQGHLVRALLEALAFQICLLFEIITKSYGTEKTKVLWVCGGAAKNDFVLQLIADLIGKPVNRLHHNECSSLGAALLAGIYSGVWKSQQEIISLRKLQKPYDVFSPNTLSKTINSKRFANWKKAVSHPLLIET